jgi:uncharacterized protein
MAGSSLFLLIDDIASVLDDVATLTKVAVKKTAGVLGDDLALNAQQVTGVNTDRELAVVWAVAKGSALNKLLLIPAALAISALLPSLIKPLLMLGGAYLCFEGVEKLAHKFMPHEDTLAVDPILASDERLETQKIAGAIRTDFILSAEIIVITLGTVEQAPLATQVVVLFSIGVVMTLGVYGLVAGIVKLDDLGLYLSAKAHKLMAKTGQLILAGAPYLMKGLSFAGTVAMFLVGGGILTHNLPAVHHAIEGIMQASTALMGETGAMVLPLVLDGLMGMAAGTVILIVVMTIKAFTVKKAG